MSRNRLKSANKRLTRVLRNSIPAHGIEQEARQARMKSARRARDAGQDPSGYLQSLRRWLFPYPVVQQLDQGWRRAAPEPETGQQGPGRVDFRQSDLERERLTERGSGLLLIESVRRTFACVRCLQALL
jgi:hypothetical protein